MTLKALNSSTDAWQDTSSCDPLFLNDVLSGLRSHPKHLPCKYLYDEAGSGLFDQICEIPEYYPTRTELGIFKACLPELAGLAGPDVQVVEYGSGNGMKTRLLLNSLQQPTSCVLIEISESYLMESARRLGAEMPGIQIIPVRADYTRNIRLASPPRFTARRLAFFPGSTVGNFEPVQAREFLQNVAQTVGMGGGLIVGVDLQKDPQILEAAYDDSAGVTSAFNKNLLKRINRELDGTFCLDDFEHMAHYDTVLHRIEMHLKAVRPVVVKVGGETVSFEAGETIHTENSYKYTVAGFELLAQSAGWTVERVWTDKQKLFSVQYLTVA